MIKLNACVSQYEDLATFERTCVWAKSIGADKVRLDFPPCDTAIGTDFHEKDALVAIAQKHGLGIHALLTHWLTKDKAQHTDPASLATLKAFAGRVRTHYGPKIAQVVTGNEVASTKPFTGGTPINPKYQASVTMAFIDGLDGAYPIITPGLAPVDGPGYMKIADFLKPYWAALPAAYRAAIVGTGVHLYSPCRDTDHAFYKSWGQLGPAYAITEKPFYVDEWNVIGQTSAVQAAEAQHALALMDAYAFAEAFVYEMQDQGGDDVGYGVFDAHGQALPIVAVLKAHGGPPPSQLDTYIAATSAADDGTYPGPTLKVAVYCHDPADLAATPTLIVDGKATPALEQTGLGFATELDVHAQAAGKHTFQSHATSKTGTKDSPVVTLTKSAPPPPKAIPFGFATGATPAELDAYKAAGARVVRTTFRVGDSWEHLDAIVDGCEKLGMLCIAQISQPASMPDLYDPAASKAFVDFAVQVGLRYGARVILELGNEVNHLRASPKPDAAKYVHQILIPAYTQLKPKVPALQIGTSGLGGMKNANGDISALEFAKGMYAAGAKDHYDLWMFHIYDYFDMPSPTSRSWSQFLQIQQFIKGQGDTHTKYGSTEVGFPTTPGSGTEQQQVQSMQAYSKLMNADPSILFWCWFEYRDNDRTATDKNPLGNDNNFGIVRHDGTHKQSYAAFQGLATAGA